MPVSIRREWRPRGLHGHKVIHRRDLRDGDEAVRFIGNLIPDVFDPNNAFSVHDALEMCRAIGADFPHRVLSAPAQRTYLEHHLSRALERGELVMISGEAVVGELDVAVPQIRGNGKAWRIGSGETALWILRREHIRPGERIVKTGNRSSIIDALLKRTDREKMAEIRKLVDIGSSEHSVQELRRRLDLALSLGEIVLVRGPGDSVSANFESVGQAAEKEHSVFTPSPRLQPTHWIEIRLIGEDGNPIPEEEYRIHLPSGEPAEGRLDKNGWARVDGIPTGGTCKVTFPNLDKDAWNRA